MCRSRPRVLFFYDECKELCRWLEHKEDEYSRWKKQHVMISRKNEKGDLEHTVKAKRLVVLEIGAGERVPSVRRESERTVYDFNQVIREE